MPGRVEEWKEKKEQFSSNVFCINLIFFIFNQKHKEKKELFLLFLFFPLYFFLEKREKAKEREREKRNLKKISKLIIRDRGIPVNVTFSILKERKKNQKKKSKKNQKKNQKKIKKKSKKNQKKNKSKKIIINSKKKKNLSNRPSNSASKLSKRAFLNRTNQLVQVWIGCLLSSRNSSSR